MCELTIARLQLDVAAPDCVAVLACRYLAIKAYTDKGLTRECPEERRFQDRTLREYRRLGMDLSDDTRNKVETLKREMKELETKYLQNIAEDDTKLCVLHTCPCFGWISHSTNCLWCPRFRRAFTKEQLKGMPDGFVSSLEKQADGKYEITMAYPHVLPILRNCAVPDTRRQVRSMVRHVAILPSLTGGSAPTQVRVAFDRRAIGENVDILEKVVKLRCELVCLFVFVFCVVFLGVTSPSFIVWWATYVQGPDCCTSWLQLARGARVSDSMRHEVGLFCRVVP